MTNDLLRVSCHDLNQLEYRRDQLNHNATDVADFLPMLFEIYFLSSFRRTPRHRVPISDPTAIAQASGP